MARLRSASEWRRGACQVREGGFLERGNFRKLKALLVIAGKVQQVEST